MLFSSDEIRAALHEHLAWWGLTRFTTDREYFSWQQQQLSPADLNQLLAQADRKRSGDPRNDISFYDLTAQPAVLPVLYSQRYDYYDTVGLRVMARVGSAARVLDFGCGVGILTTFYARQFPDQEFVGLDRSAGSLAVAQQKARELGLANVRFDCVDAETARLSGRYDLIVATHALMQAEQDPGIPSESWRTFMRAHDAGRRASFEQRTGLGVRLDQLSTVLDQNGRMIVCEKTRQLARRVPFQWALAERGLRLVEPPELIRYQSVEEVTDDGPLYHMQKGGAVLLDWNETTDLDDSAPFDPSNLRRQSRDPDAPLYENHKPAAQAAWEQLNDRRVIQETTRQEPDGRQLHVELGMSEGLMYLYCANTFDQRQLVIVEPSRAAMLDSYYQEIIGSVG
ncbi:MAG: methyltransferase domain-containing protein [Nitrospira sp.]|nr:methyltransferase domain-containing protein [Nitrospira sp.]